MVIPSIGITAILAAAATVGISAYAYLRPIYTFELKLGLPPGKYTTLNKLRYPPNLVSNWRALELYLREFCQALGFVLIPIQTIFMQLSLFCNVTMIVFGSQLEITSKILLPLCSINPLFAWTLFLTVAGQLFSSSKKTLGSWKLERWTGAERKFMMKFKRSFRPLSICAGKFFVVRPKSALNFVKGVSRGTFRSLIAMRKVL